MSTTTTKTISYRAWDKITQKIYNVSTLELSAESVTLEVDDDFNNDFERDAKDVILSEFLNLLDKKDKQIHIGDIVKVDGKFYNYLITYNPDWCAYVLDNESALDYVEFSNLDIRHSRVWDLEVIGNVFEDSELMEI